MQVGKRQQRGKKWTGSDHSHYGVPKHQPVLVRLCPGCTGSNEAGISGPGRGGAKTVIWTTVTSGVGGPQKIVRDMGTAGEGRSSKPRQNNHRQYTLGEARLTSRGEITRAWGDREWAWSDPE